MRNGNTTGSGRPRHFDVIVIGTGTMGAAACWHLAGRGQRVLGLDKFHPPHERGSHAGQSRIVRKAYYEHSDYVPLLTRAYEGWRALERDAGVELFHRTGIVYFGEPENENIAGVRLAASTHGVPIELWPRAQAAERFPGFVAPPHFETIFEPDAGFVTPERAVESFLREAQRHGAEIRTGMEVLSWKDEGTHLRVSTAGEEFTAGKLVVTAGAWTAQVLGSLRPMLKVTRQLLAWVSPPQPELFTAERFPCWFVEDPGNGTFYGFPMRQEAGQPPLLKLAHHHPGVPSAPDDIDGEVPASELEKLRAFLRMYLPAAGENIVRTKQCLYTYSPDTHFMIDCLPGSDNRVTIACGFSGHGFKFAPVVGEALADLAMHGRTALPIGFLGLHRFPEMAPDVG